VGLLVFHVHVEYVQHLFRQVVFLYEFLDSLIDAGNASELKDVRSFLVVLVQQKRNQHFEVRVCFIRQRLVVFLDDFVKKLVHLVCVEGFLERDKFVQNHAQGPHVCL